MAVHSEPQTARAIGLLCSFPDAEAMEGLSVSPNPALSFVPKSHAMALALGLQGVGLGALKGLWPSERGLTLRRRNETTAKIGGLVGGDLAEAVGWRGQG